MFDAQSLVDPTRQPALAELSAWVHNPAFDALCEHLFTEYGAAADVMYSGDKVLLGWNVRFYKAGRTLCRLYPKDGYFSALLVVGRREKDAVEALLAGMSEQMQTVYRSTQEGMGQRWLLVDVYAQDALYRDLVTLICIRRGAGGKRRTAIVETTGESTRGD